MEVDGWRFVGDHKCRRCLGVFHAAGILAGVHYDIDRFSPILSFTSFDPSFCASKSGLLFHYLEKTFTGIVRG